MADIKAIAEELVKMSAKDVQELAAVMNKEYDIEPAAQVYQMKEQVRMLEDAEWFRDTSPKQYGISLLNRKRKRR